MYSQRGVVACLDELVVHQRYQIGVAVGYPLCNHRPVLRISPQKLRLQFAVASNKAADGVVAGDRGVVFAKGLCAQLRLLDDCIRNELQGLALSTEMCNKRDAGTKLTLRQLDCEGGHNDDSPLKLGWSLFVISELGGLI